MKKPVLDSRRWFALALLCTAQFMMILDFSIVNVALPSIQQALGFSQQNLQWVVSAYALTFGGFLLLGGRAADLFGRRRVFMAGLGLFSLASLVGGLAQFQWVLLSARVFQGLGAAIVSPTALSLLTTTFKEGAERNRALSVWGAVSAGGFAAGVLLGGILTDGLSWRWVWFVDVPIGIVVFALTPVLLSESRERTATRHIDLAGAVTVTAGLVALVYALVQASETGWGSFQIICSFGISLILLAAFVIIELRSQAPLVPLRIFRLRTLTGANLVVLLMGAASASMLFILTLYMQRVLNYSALQTGLAFLPHALAAMVAAPPGSRFSTRFGVKSTLTGGMILLMLGLLLLSQISTSGGFVSDLLPGTVVVGFGIVLILVAGTIAATAGVSNSEQGLASGLFNTSQQVGAALGLAILVAASTARTKTLVESAGNSPPELRTALTEGFQYALTISVSFPIAGVLVALFVIRESECRRAKTRAIR
jgi:EmrB/QacA subfamily drug resistance transporter